MNDADQAKAGLETDIQIAEQVLGWKKLYPPCHACWSRWRPHYDREGQSVCLPNFSANMNAAMEIWAAAFQGRKLCLQQGPEKGDWAWGVFEVDPDNFHEPVAFAPTPALAICRAALGSAVKKA